MRRSLAFVLLVGAAVLAGGGSLPAMEPEDLPEGPGREETFYTCSACHSFALVAQQGLSRERWDALLDWMAEEQGMDPLGGEERRLVLDYLSTWFGPDRAFATRHTGG